MVAPFWFALTSVAQAPASGAASGPADFVLYAPTVRTLDPARPAAEFVAWRGDRIVAVGARGEAAAWIGAKTGQWEAPAGCVALPGIVDAHAHLFGLGQSLRELDLVGTASFEEVVARTAERVGTTPAGRWIRGRGWDHNDWPTKAFPHHAALSAATPGVPVLLQRIDGHAALANARALALAGIDERTVAPAGGEIVRDARGVPTGVLIDRAVDLVVAAIPPPTGDEERAALRLALDHAAANGVTALHDAGIGRERLALLQEEAEAGRLTLRIHAMLDGEDRALLDEWFARGPSSDARGFLQVRAVKLYADGALGSQGAWLHEEYADRKGHRGLPLIDRETLVDVATRALAAGFQLCTHAIGDAANTLVLDAYEAALAKHAAAHPGAPRPDHRFRVEHAQLLAPGDVGRFAKLGVIASMQWCHATSDAPWVPTRLGAERAAREAYAWRSLLDAGALLCNGTDAPVEPLSPWRNLAAAITRCDPDGGGDVAFLPEQRLTGEEALAASTRGAAYAAFREQEQGLLRAGAWADVIVVRGDPTRLDSKSWRALEVVGTWVGGKRVDAAAAGKR